MKIPTAEIAAQIFLDHAAAGEKAKMFRDEEKYSTLTDNLLVGVHAATLSPMMTSLDRRCKH